MKDESFDDSASTHFVYDGKTIQISPNIRIIFDFLMEIEKESDAILGFEAQLEEIHEYYLDLLKCTQELTHTLKENKIENLSYVFKKNPLKFSERIQFHVPVRTQMIQLFTQLEVLFFFYLAYTQEVDGETELRELAMKKEKLRKDFLREFLLSEKNLYYKKQRNRFKKLEPGKIIRLRNSLVHFFSLSNDSIGIYSSKYTYDARKIEMQAEKNKKGDLVMLSPGDLNELIKDAYMILFQIWTKDTYNENAKFKRKIKYVYNIVSEFGAVVAYFDKNG